MWKPCLKELTVKVVYKHYFMALTLRFFHKDVKINSSRLIKVYNSYKYSNSKLYRHEHLCLEYSYFKIHTELATYTGCPGRNVKNFGRVFLMLKYTDITQNTYIQS
jgi:hypothetical protein